MSRVLVAIVAASLMLLTAATAHAETVIYRGKTNQGYSVRAEVDGGILQRLKFAFRGDCRAPGYRWGPVRGLSWVNDPKRGPIKQTGAKFSDHGRLVTRRRHFRSVVTTRLAGRIDGDRISGSQSAVLRQRDHGARDVCKSRVRFSARRVTTD
jgi:hypothetical protein